MTTTTFPRNTSASTRRACIEYRSIELPRGQRFSTVINGTEPLYVTRIEVAVDTARLCGFRSRLSLLNPRRTFKRHKWSSDACVAQQSGLTRHHRALIAAERQKLAPSTIPHPRGAKAVRPTPVA